MSKLKARLRAHKIVITVMSVFLIASFAVGVKAYQGYAPTTVIENGTITINNPAPVMPDVPSENLGAFLTPCENHNGIEVCSYAEGFNQASTTLFAVKNPWNATSTVDYFAMEGHVGSTSINIYVGTSTVSSIPIRATTSVTGTDISASLVNATQVATSSKFYIKNGENAVSGSGQVAAGASSLSKMIVGPSEYIVGYASGTHPNLGGLTVDNSATSTAGSSITSLVSGDVNKFFGNYGLRFFKHQTPQTN